MLLRFVFLFLISLLMTSVEAKSTRSSTHHNAKSQKAVKAHSPVQASLIADSKTGTVLHAENATIVTHPASLTKMMTLYLAFDALRQKKFSMHTLLPVSSHAQKQIPLKLWLRAGQKISVGDAIMGTMVHSANDAAVVLAEAMGGSEVAFASKMNVMAKKLGLKNTHFRNASGLPDKKQITTAVDMARLGMALKEHFPEHYHLFKKTSFVYNGNVIKGHNRVVSNYPGAEGMKTGFTNWSGCNLVTTASRGDASLIGVVLGGSSSKVRDKKMMTLLDRHFGVEDINYDTIEKVQPRKSHKIAKKSRPNVKLAQNKSKKRNSGKRV